MAFPEGKVELEDCIQPSAKAEHVPHHSLSPTSPAKGTPFLGSINRKRASRKRLSEKCLLREKQRQEHLDCTLYGFFGGSHMNPHSGALSAVGEMGPRERFGELLPFPFPASSSPVSVAQPCPLFRQADVPVAPESFP